MSKLEIKNGNNWLAAMDEEKYFVKFVGMPSDINAARNMALIYIEDFKNLREFAEFVRGLGYKFASVSSRAK